MEEQPKEETNNTTTSKTEPINKLALYGLLSAIISYFSLLLIFAVNNLVFSFVISLVVLGIVILNIIALLSKVKKLKWLAIIGVIISASNLAYLAFYTVIFLLANAYNN